MSYVELINILIYKCRICLEEDGTIDIFTTPMLENNVELCTNITVSENDGNPKCICSSCNDLIITSVRLRNLAADADQRLRRIQNSVEVIEIGLLNNCTPSIEVSKKVYCPLQNVKPILPDLLLPTTRSKTNRKKRKLLEALERSAKRSKDSPIIKTEEKCNLGLSSKLHCAKIKKEELPQGCQISKLHCAKIKKEELPQDCQICGKIFLKHRAMYHHLRTHDLIKKNQCPDCPKAFYSKSDLRKHCRVHTGEKPYVCSICSRGFTQNVSLKSHMMTVHKRLLNPYASLDNTS